jgi:Common central domain of tyrosinase
MVLTNQLDLSTCTALVLNFENPPSPDSRAVLLLVTSNHKSDYICRQALLVHVTHSSFPVCSMALCATTYVLLLAFLGLLSNICRAAVPSEQISRRVVDPDFQNPVGSSQMFSRSRSPNLSSSFRASMPRLDCGNCGVLKKMKCVAMEANLARKKCGSTRQCKSFWLRTKQSPSRTSKVYLCVSKKNTLAETNVSANVPNDASRLKSSTCVGQGVQCSGSKLCCGSLICAAKVFGSRDTICRVSAPQPPPPVCSMDGTVCSASTKCCGGLLCASKVFGSRDTICRVSAPQPPPPVCSKDGTACSASTKCCGGLLCAAKVFGSRDTICRASEPDLRRVDMPQRGTCSDEGGVRIRSEIMDLSNVQWSAYHDAVQKLHSRIGSDGLSDFEKFIEAHASEEFQGHGGAYFVVWHRQFLWEFESALRRINPSVTVCADD